MDTIAEDARLPVNLEAQTVVQAAATLRPVLRRYDEEIEREQHLPKAVVAHLLASGAYQMLIPRALGGLQVDPLTYLRVWSFWPRAPAPPDGTSPTMVFTNSLRLAYLTRVSPSCTLMGLTPSSLGPPCREAGRVSRSRVVIASADAGASAAAAWKRPGWWEAFRFLTVAKCASALKANRFTGGGSFHGLKWRSLREAGK